jgi:hypothetical protein
MTPGPDHQQRCILGGIDKNLGRAALDDVQIDL